MKIGAGRTATKALAILSPWDGVYGMYHNGNDSAPCESPLYCYGQILQDIQLARPFADSKTFVDMYVRHHWSMPT